LDNYIANVKQSYQKLTFEYTALKEACHGNREQQMGFRGEIPVLRGTCIMEWIVKESNNSNQRIRQMCFGGEFQNSALSKTFCDH